MTSFRVLTGIDDDFLPIRHHDRRVFPDDSVWYLLIGQTVSFDVLEPRFYESRNEGTEDRVLLPLTRARGRWGVITVSSMDNYYSVDYRPLCATGKAMEQIDTLMEHVIRKESPDILCLRALDAEAQETVFLERALQTRGWQVFRETCQINWVHHIVGDYQDYIQSRPRRLQNTLRRKSAQLKRLPGMQMSVHYGQVGLDEILAAYGTVYAKSWKVPEPHPEFVPGLIRAAAKRGQLRLGLLAVNNVPVAVHFWVVKHRRAFIYKLAHDREFDMYSPGTVLMAEMIRHVLAHDEVQRLDFLSGDDQYKQDWMSERREKLMLYAYNPQSARAQILRFRDEYAKPFVKRLAGLNIC